MTVKKLPLVSNGHALLPKRVEEVTAFESSFGELVVIGAHSRCADCDQAPVYVVGEEAVHVQSPCPFPDGITMQITLEVPSGQMIVTDDLRAVHDVDFDAGASYSTALGMAQVVEAMAALGCAFGPVFNTCPGLYRTHEPDSYLIAAPVIDEADVPSLPEETRLARISTALWAYSIADVEDWKAKAGDVDQLGKYTVVDVTPGTYRFTLHAGERGFDHYAEGTVVFAHVELVTEAPAH
ncbi:hypothetical protein [Streptomyces nanshensis]|uniref:Uncharacterized protein n=1 Tax=Streptomyces nanshensis TaxID=518642 RepID=A0A1E7KZH1_9ACTN|nr:hypothetical protein [Streptomyces nanshensis]OEV09203.1 hypothetical protein AN218_22255 [Streptomyces nanshensis]